MSATGDADHEIARFRRHGRRCLGAPLPSSPDWIKLSERESRISVGTATLSSRSENSQTERSRSMLGCDMRERIDQCGCRCVAMLAQLWKQDVANGRPEVGLGHPRVALGWLVSHVQMLSKLQVKATVEGTQSSRRRRLADGTSRTVRMVSRSPGASDRTISSIAVMICSRSWSS